MGREPILKSTFLSVTPAPHGAGQLPNLKTTPIMKFKLLGKSGLRVSELCLGSMTFGDDWKQMGMAAGNDEARSIFDAFAGAGGNFIDTANFYNNGSSEKLVGEFIATERDRFVLATKYSLTMRPNDPNGGGNHRKNMIQSLDASLKRLKTDYIDVYWLHIWDFTTPVDEVMRALDDAVTAGKILYVGISDTPSWVVARANTLAELRGWSEFVGLQVQYSLLERSVERELLPMARDLDIGVTAWSPLGMGLLTGKYGASRSLRPSAPDSAVGRLALPAMAAHPLNSEKNFSNAKRVTDLAAEFGLNPSLVALSWLRHKGVIPIVGARQAAQMRENLGCVDLNLSTEQIQLLDQATGIDLGFPHDLLASAQSIIHGKSVSLLENHH
jgi:aryl-alcohol dehydrogenase-like predicted oxidoreductase